MMVRFWTPGQPNDLVLGPFDWVHFHKNDLIDSNGHHLAYRGPLTGDWYRDGRAWESIMFWEPVPAHTQTCDATC